MAHAVEQLAVILRKKPPFYFAKFIDHFITEVKPSHQAALLQYIADEVGSDKWDKLARDHYEHVVLARSILWHYSGREENKKEPSAVDLALLIDDYMKSPAFNAADVELTPKKSFGSMMEEI